MIIKRAMIIQRKANKIMITFIESKIKPIVMIRHRLIKVLPMMPSPRTTVYL